MSARHNRTPLHRLTTRHTERTAAAARILVVRAGLQRDMLLA